jgi:hypothetical protein
MDWCACVCVCVCVFGCVCALCADPPQARLSDPALNRLVELLERLSTINEATCDMFLRRVLAVGDVVAGRINLASVRARACKRPPPHRPAGPQPRPCILPYPSATGCVAMHGGGASWSLLHGRARCWFRVAGVCPVQGVFVAAVLVVHLGLYLPIIRKMDVTIKRSRSMLLLFPGEVVHSVVSIRDTMAAYAKGLR